jgi:hypothetical protein
MRIHNLLKPGRAQVRALCLTHSQLATVDDRPGLGARMSVQDLERGGWSFEVRSGEVFLGQVIDLAAVLQLAANRKTPNRNTYQARVTSSRRPPPCCHLPVECAAEHAFLLLESEG